MSKKYKKKGLFGSMQGNAADVAGSIDPPFASNFTTPLLRIDLPTKSYYVNRGPLQRLSGYFARRIDFDGSDRSVEWNSWPPLLEQCFELVVEYIYTGSYKSTAIHLDKSTAALGIYVIADYLIMPKLKEKAITSLQECRDDDNFRLPHKGEPHGLQELVRLLYHDPFESDDAAKFEDLVETSIKVSGLSVSQDDELTPVNSCLPAQDPRRPMQEIFARCIASQHRALAGNADFQALLCEGGQFAPDVFNALSRVARYI